MTVNDTKVNEESLYLETDEGTCQQYKEAFERNRQQMKAVLCAMVSQAIICNKPQKAADVTTRLIQTRFAIYIELDSELERLSKSFWKAKKRKHPDWIFPDQVIAAL